MAACTEDELGPFLSLLSTSIYKICSYLLHTSDWACWASCVVWEEEAEREEEIARSTYVMYIPYIQTGRYVFGKVPMAFKMYYYVGMSYSAGPGFHMSYNKYQLSIRSPFLTWRPFSPARVLSSFSPPPSREAMTWKYTCIYNARAVNAALFARKLSTFLFVVPPFFSFADPKNI